MAFRCWFWLVTLVPLAGHSQLLDPTELYCASVELNGDATLTWEVVPDPFGVFDRYEVLQATALAGPYNVVGSITDRLQTTFTHVGAGADAGARFYHVVAVSADGPSPPSDTLATLFMDLAQSTPLGSAVLNWNQQHQPPLLSAAGQYDVFMEYPQGVWNAVGQVGNTVGQYLHEISICSDSLTFRVGIANAAGCYSFSNVRGDEFEDVTPPTMPVVTTVSVDTLTGSATVTWSPSPQGDTEGYIVVLVGPLGNVILDTLYGIFNTTYTYPLSQAGQLPESFTVAAFDSCWTGNPPSPNTSATRPPHTSIHARTTYDRCGSEILVEWTPYVGWDVQFYQVFAKVGAGPFFLLGTASATQTSMLHPSVIPFTSYCYVVKAIQAGGPATSLSNKACRITDYPPIPAFNYIRTATVLADDRIEVVDSVDMAAQAKRYRLERSANGAPYELIATRAGAGAGPLVTFEDGDVDTRARSYSYRILVEDSCGTEVLQSNTASTIHLRATADLEGFNRLEWNGYGQWAGLVSGYVIHRSVGGEPFQPIGFNQPDVWTFDDPVDAFAGSNGRFCYYVEAIEAGNPSGFQARSLSNEVCAIQPEQFWMPNAFIAGGVNDSFKPVTAFTGFRTYELVIYNRWGQVIWNTRDPDTAWNGMVSGSYVPQGVYGWTCSFENGAGQRFEKRGTVTFLWAREP